MRASLAALMLCLAGTMAHAESGIASVYSGKSDEGGSRASNGERIDPRALTAAHRTLPFNSIVKVTNKINGRFVVVRINDRGPWRRGRIIDLTPAGARQIGMNGLAPVTLARF